MPQTEQDLMSQNSTCNYLVGHLKTLQILDAMELAYVFWASVDRLRR
jgi:hypothetical protein